MSFEHIRYFHRFSKGIVATTRVDALILSLFLKDATNKGIIYECHEVLDFQRYKVVKKKRRVAKFSSLDETKKNFRFLVCSN